MSDIIQFLIGAFVSVIAVFILCFVPMTLLEEKDVRKEEGNGEN